MYRSFKVAMDANTILRFCNNPCKKMETVVVPTGNEPTGRSIANTTMLPTLKNEEQSKFKLEISKKKKKKM